MSVTDEDREKARAAVLTERGTCGQLSPHIAGGQALMCELVPGHDGAHQATDNPQWPPMRWIEVGSPS